MTTQDTGYVDVEQSMTHLFVYDLSRIPTLFTYQSPKRTRKRKMTEAPRPRARLFIAPEQSLCLR